MKQGINFFHDCGRYVIRIQVDDTLLPRQYAELPKDAIEYICLTTARHIRREIKSELDAWQDNGHRNREHRYRFTLPRYRVAITVTGKDVLCFPDTNTVGVVLHHASVRIQNAIERWLIERREAGGHYKRW